MAAPVWVDDEVVLVAVLVVEVLWVLVPEETVEGTERVLATEGEVCVLDGTASVVLLDMKLLESRVDEATDPELEPPVEVELATEVVVPAKEESLVELPPSVEDPDVEVVSEVELPVEPLTLKVPDQLW